MVFGNETYKLDYFVVVTYADETSKRIAHYFYLKEAQTRCTFYRKLYEEEFITGAVLSIKVRFEGVFE